MMINGSEESGIDVLETNQKLASTVSMDGKRKYVILDELTILTTIYSTRSLEVSWKSLVKCGFILHNFRNRIIEPLHSRCSTVEFLIPTEERPK